MFLFPLFPTMMDDDDALLPLTETMLFRKEREKTDDDVMLLLKNVCKCVLCVETKLSRAAVVGE